MSIYSIEIKDKNKKLEYYETVFPRLNEFYENNYKTVEINKEKANKYDSLVEKIKDRIKSVEKCYQDLIEPYFDKSINIINTACITKKEKEEFINKRNCLIVQKKSFEETLKLLNSEKESK